MHCALLVLVALLKVQALRTEPLEFTARQNELTIPDKDKDTNLQMINVPQALIGQMQDWNRLQTIGEQDSLSRIMDADVEDKRDYYEYPDEQLQSIDQLDDVQVARMSNYLLKVLQRPNVYEAPVLFLKDPINQLSERPYPLEFDDLKNVSKRTRYYRRYRNYQSPDYDPYNTCTLTKKDVFKLLVALHDARQGNKTRTVSFCNRKRPASAVYTNMRFLGRRRK